MLEKAQFGDTEVRLRVLSLEEFYKLGKQTITSVFCLPVKSDKLLLTLNPRGWDFIGGHVEEGETSYKALLRESLEEGAVKVNQAKVLGLIEVFNSNWKEEDKYPETAYQVFYKTEDFNLGEFKLEHECLDCDFINISELDNKHHNLLQVHKQLIDLI